MNLVDMPLHVSLGYELGLTTIFCKRRVSSSNGLHRYVSPSLHFVQISADNHPLCKRKASSSDELHRRFSPSLSSDNHLPTTSPSPWEFHLLDCSLPALLED